MKQRIASVILWGNGMVMVFDQRGEQMPDYQGRLPNVRDAILRDATPETVFEHGVWRQGTTAWNRDAFATAAFIPESPAVQEGGS